MWVAQRTLYTYRKTVEGCCYCSRSPRLKIHFLYNNVDKNVLKTSDASCLCEKWVDINDKRLSYGSLWQCSNSTVYLQLSAIKIPKKLLFLAVIDRVIKPLPKVIKKISSLHFSCNLPKTFFYCHTLLTVPSKK